MKKLLMIMAGVLALGATSPVQGAITFDGGTILTSTASISGFTFTYSTGAAVNPNLALAVESNNSRSATGVSLNAATAISKGDISFTGSTTHHLSVWVYPNATASTAYTVVISLSGATSSEFAVELGDYSGLDPFTPFGVTATSNSTGSTHISTTASTSFTNSLLTDWWALAAGGNVTNDGSVTQRFHIQNASGGPGGFGLNDLLTTAVQNYTINNTAATAGAYGQWLLELVPIQPTATPTGTNTPSPTSTRTPTPTWTFTASPTSTFTASPTQTQTFTITSTFTASPTPTFTASPTMTATPACATSGLTTTAGTSWPAQYKMLMKPFTLGVGGYCTGVYLNVASGTGQASAAIYTTATPSTIIARSLFYPVAPGWNVIPFYSYSLPAAQYQLAILTSAGVNVSAFAVNGDSYYPDHYGQFLNNLVPIPASQTFSIYGQFCH